MKNIDLQKFKDAVELLKKEKKITKTEIAASLGYKLNSFSNILQGITKLSPELIREFCKKYKWDIKEFINDETDKNYNSLDNPTMFDIGTVRNRISSIEQQMDVLYKTNKMMKQLYLSGIELSDSQYNNMKTLRELIGY